MAKSELKDLYEKIAKSGTGREYITDSIDFEAIIDHFKDVENQDRPDGIISVEDTVYMVEHFQISIYWNENGDKLQQALRAKNTKKLGSNILLFNERGDWEHQLLDNWLTGFSCLLDKHLEHYYEYEENTHKQYPGKPCKFILAVEDNSNSIITDDNFDDLCILDIQEFVNKILSYNQIDGVIVVNTSSSGSSVIAKDRESIKADNNSGKLQSLSSCDILTLILRVMINGLTPEERANFMEKICHILVSAKETISFEDSFCIIEK